MTIKKTFLMTSPVILAPILYGLAVYSSLPSKMTTHWGFTNQPNGFMAKPLLVFGLPLLMLVFQFIVLFATGHSKDSAPRLNHIVIWLLPLVTVVAYLTTIQFNLGTTIDIRRIATLLVAIIFLSMGNYLPTVTLSDQSRRQIKNPTQFYHRIGYLLVGGGLALLISLLFGPWASTVILGLVIVGLVGVILL